MYKITLRKELNPTVTMMEIEAPLVAKKAEPGQFIILRVNEDGERIPLTIAGYDREKGTVRIIFQIVGATTTLLNAKKEGEYIQDFVGPLGVGNPYRRAEARLHRRRRRGLRDRSAHCTEAARNGLRGNKRYRFPQQGSADS